MRTGKTTLLLVVAAISAGPPALESANHREAPITAFDQIGRAHV